MNPCSCCAKENQFCRCNDHQKCSRCCKCPVHCDCRVPKIAPTLERPKGDRSICRAEGCGQEIWWVRTAKGRLTPTNSDGSTHWGTCVGAGQFHRRKTVKGTR
jgi:hypothetical protein